MALDFFTQNRLEYYYGIYNGKTKEQLFTDLDDTLKQGTFEMDEEQRIKLLVIEEELLKLIHGYELLNYYKSKIKVEKLIIDENQFNLNEINRQYKILLTKNGLIMLLTYSIPTFIFISVLIFVPLEYVTIHALNTWVFGGLTLIGLVWLLIQPLVIYLLFPFINGLLELPRVLIWFIQFNICSLRDYLIKHMHKL